MGAGMNAVSEMWSSSGRTFWDSWIDCSNLFENHERTLPSLSVLLQPRVCYQPWWGMFHTKSFFANLLHSLRGFILLYEKFIKIGEVFNCGVAEYCIPWIKNYADYQKGSTLLLANAGSHVHDVDTFPAVWSVKSPTWSRSQITSSLIWACRRLSIMAPIFRIQRSS